MIQPLQIVDDLPFPIAPLGLFAPSLKAPDAARWLRERVAALKAFAPERVHVLLAKASWRGRVPLPRARVEA